MWHRPPFTVFQAAYLIVTGTRERFHKTKTSPMAQNSYLGVAILSPGNSEARRNTTAENSRFSDLFRAFAARRIHVEPAIYDDDFCADVREQLMRVNGVLVWVNPIEGGRDRSILDSMLRDVAIAGVFVSTHPDVILQLGTK